MTTSVQFGDSVVFYSGRYGYLAVAVDENIEWFFSPDPTRAAVVKIVSAGSTTSGNISSTKYNSNSPKNGKFQLQFDAGGTILCPEEVTKTELCDGSKSNTVSFAEGGSLDLSFTLVDGTAREIKDGETVLIRHASKNSRYLVHCGDSQVAFENSSRGKVGVVMHKVTGATCDAAHRCVYTLPCGTAGTPAVCPADLFCGSLNKCVNCVENTGTPFDGNVYSCCGRRISGNVCAQCVGDPGTYNLENNPSGCPPQLTGEGCKNNNECFPGSVCDESDKICRELKGIDESCFDDAECASGFCSKKNRCKKKTWPAWVIGILFGLLAFLVIGVVVYLKTSQAKAANQADPVIKAQKDREAQARAQFRDAQEAKRREKRDGGSGRTSSGRASKSTTPKASSKGAPAKSPKAPADRD